MPFSRPTLTQLRTNVQSDIAAALPGTDALLRYSNLGIIGEIVAKLANGQYGYLDFIARQSVPFTATDEYLEGWAALRSVTRKPAVGASGLVTFVGTNGATIPAGTPMTRADGVGYTSTSAQTIAGGSAVVPVIAALAGALGNAALGAALTLASGVIGVQSTGIATAPLLGGADIEDNDAFRGRMLQAYASPPQGGALTDFITWALAVPGVTRAWASTGSLGAGTVSVFFMMDNSQAANNGFPQGVNGVAGRETRRAIAKATGDQLALAEALFDLQPATALVYAVAPTPNTVYLAIGGLGGAGASVQAQIYTAAANAVQLNAALGGTTDISTIEAAINGVTGATGFVITGVTCSAGSVAPGPAGNITSNPGALPVLGGITYL